MMRKPYTYSDANNSWNKSDYSEAWIVILILKLYQHILIHC